MVKNYFDGWRRILSFSGRSTRAEFWTFNIVNFLLVYLAYFFMMADIISNAGEGGSSLGGFISLFLLIFTIPYIIASWSIAVRRLHDIGKSGFFLLVGLIPVIGSIILLVFYLLPSE